MSSRRYRIGVIGLGGMGRNHAEACRAEADVDLVAGCDVVEAARVAWGEKFGVRGLYADYREMLDREKLDLVIISTHAPDHPAPTIAAAERGVNVFCEKPLAATLAQADAMVDACDKAGVKLAVNHIKRG